MTEYPPPGWNLICVRLHGAVNRSPVWTAEPVGRRHMDDSAKKVLTSPEFRHRHQAVQWAHEVMHLMFGWDRKTRTFSPIDGVRYD